MWVPIFIDPFYGQSSNGDVDLVSSRRRVLINGRVHPKPDTRHGVSKVFDGALTADMWAIGTAPNGNFKQEFGTISLET